MSEGVRGRAPHLPDPSLEASRVAAAMSAVVAAGPDKADHLLPFPCSRQPSEPSVTHAPQRFAAQCSEITTLRRFGGRQQAARLKFGRTCCMRW